MAYFALASLEAKLQDFYKLIEKSSEQSKTKQRVKFIIERVAKMRKIAREAESIEEDINLDQEIWNSQVRKVAYEAEDFVDGIMLRVKGNGLEGNGGCGSLHPKAESVMDTRVIGVVKGLKSVFEELSRMRYPDKKPILISEKTDTRVFDGSIIPPTPDKSYHGETEKHLINLLTSADPRLKVISLLGMGGLGKTTLAEKVYQDAYMKKRFECHAWLRVSPTFKAADLVKELIQLLYKEKKMSNPNADQMDLLTLRKFLENRSYMIVLDDVWSFDFWEEIQDAFPIGTNGNRVVITTRVPDVAYASCASKDHICKLQPLTDDESWALFSDKAFRGGKCPDHLIDISKKILEKCHGLPLAIVAISGLLITSDAESWSELYQYLGNPFRSIPNILSLSYLSLPYDLRACLLYISIFLEDRPISVTKLLRLWIAEGFVVKERGKTAEEVAKQNLEQLLKRSLVQVAETTSDGRVKTCRIHDLLRETIIRKSRNHNFAAISKANRGDWPDMVRRLSVHNSFQSVRHQDLSRVRSLLMFEVEEPLSKKSWPSFFTGGCNLLTVLDLQGAALSKFPLVILDMLSLKYLSMRSTNVDKIPNSIGKLKRLETLDLKSTPVSKLPKGILKLRLLRNLLVYRVKSEPFKFFNTKFGAKVPKDIGDLTTLQKLCFVDGGQGTKVMLAGLGRLTDLRRLGIINLIDENCETLGISLNKLSNIHALSVNCSKGKLLTLPRTFHPTELRRLYLGGKLNTLPPWIGSLQNLVKVFLKFSKLRDSPLTILQQLPELVHIELLQAYEGTKLCFKAGEFKKLKILGIVELLSLNGVTIENTAAPNLERLVLDGCGMLKMLPSGIEHLARLKELHLVNMPEELNLSIKSVTGEGVHFDKVRHIPEITTSTYTMDGWKIENLSTGSSYKGLVGEAAMKGMNELREK